MITDLLNNKFCVPRTGCCTNLTHVLKLGLSAVLAGVHSMQHAHQRAPVLIPCSSILIVFQLQRVDMLQDLALLLMNSCPIELLAFF
jgi:hypothetical protein